VRERIEYRFRVLSAAIFTLYSYSKTLKYPFRVPTVGSLRPDDPRRPPVPYRLDILRGISQPGQLIKSLPTHHLCCLQGYNVGRSSALRRMHGPILILGVYQLMEKNGVQTVSTVSLCIHAMDSCHMSGQCDPPARNFFSQLMDQS
jgi:hypothetical protein